MSKTQVTIPVFVPHMGCPHKCAFCNQWMSSSAKYLPDISSIDKKVNSYLKKISKNVSHIEIAFFGGSFTGIPENIQREMLTCAAAFLDKKLIHGIRLSTRPDYINSEKLNLLKRFGVTTIELGVQSLSDRVLSASNRGHSSRDSIQAVKLIKEHGFKTVIQLMPGLPEDTFSQSIESARITADLNPDSVRIYPTIILKNTKLETMYKNNQYTPLTMNDAIELCKEMYLIFDKVNIPVIRLGLHPLSSEDSNAVIAGPYHPSFGFFVKARIKRDVIEKKIQLLFDEEKCSEKSKLTIKIPKNCSEEYIGYKKENIIYLKNNFKLMKVDYNIHKEKVLTIDYT